MSKKRDRTTLRVMVATLGVNAISCAVAVREVVVRGGEVHERVAGGRIVARVDLTMWNERDGFLVRRRPTLAADFVHPGCENGSPCARVHDDERVIEVCAIARGEAVTDLRGETSTRWIVVEYRPNAFGFVPSILLVGRSRVRLCTGSDVVEIVAATATAPADAFGPAP